MGAAGAGLVAVAVAAVEAEAAAGTAAAAAPTCDAAAALQSPSLSSFHLSPHGMPQHAGDGEFLLLRALTLLRTAPDPPAALPGALAQLNSPASDMISSSVLQCRLRRSPATCMSRHLCLLSKCSAVHTSCNSHNIRADYYECCRPIQFPSRALSVGKPPLQGLSSHFEGRHLTQAEAI